MYISTGWFPFCNQYVYSSRVLYFTTAALRIVQSAVLAGGICHILYDTCIVPCNIIPSLLYTSYDTSLHFEMHGVQVHLNSCDTRIIHTAVAAALRIVESAVLLSNVQCWRGICHFLYISQNTLASYTGILLLWSPGLGPTVQHPNPPKGLGVGRLGRSPPTLVLYGNCVTAVVCSAWPVACTQQQQQQQQ